MDTTIRWTKHGERILVLPNGKEVKIGTVSIKKPKRSEENDTCEHGNSYASNCSDCDEEAINEKRKC